MMFLIWAAGGWCGTPWRHWPVPPGPGPDPWWIWKVAGVIGGLGLGALVHGLFSSDPMPGIVASVIGGRVLGDLADRFAGGTRG